MGEGANWEDKNIFGENAPMSPAAPPLILTLSFPYPIPYSFSTPDPKSNSNPKPYPKPNPNSVGLANLFWIRTREW